MNSVKYTNVPPVRRRHKALHVLIAFCALASLLSGVSVARDIYLAVREDANSGSGSAQDPFDASSAAKFDAILDRFREDTNFFYSPGIYETTGGHYRTRPTANQRCHHFGAGIDRTVIRLVGAWHPTEEGTIFYADYDATVDGFELHNLTLDCNAPGNPQFRDGLGAVGAVNVVGNNMLFSNLKVVHFGTGKRGVECFPFFSFAGPGHAGGKYENIRLENSVFTDPAVGNKDGLSCAVIAASTSARIQGAIVNCRFINLKSDFTYSHAFAAPLCEGNDVEGSDTGFYLEPDDRQFGTWIIRKNRFRDIITAAMVNWHPTGSLNTIQFEDNNVVLEAEPRRTSVAFGIDDTGLKSGDPSPAIAKIIFRNNKISLAEPSRGQITQAAGIHLVSQEARYSVGDLLLEDNVFNLPSGREMIISPAPVVRSFIQRNNVDSNKTAVRVRDVHGNLVNSL
jgi:hypothetical protein